MDTETDPRLEAFNNATPEGKLRLLYILGLDLAAWLQQIDQALTEEFAMTAEEVLELFDPEGPAN